MATLVDSHKRQYSREYYLPVGDKEEKVCKQFFKKLFSVSDGRLTRLLKPKFLGGTPPQDRRGKHSNKRTSDTSINQIKSFINKFPCYESHYSRIKNLNRKYLSPNLNLNIIYKLYKNEVSEPVSIYVFRDVFNKQFNLHFHSPISDSCKKCDYFNMKLKCLTNDDEKSIIETERELHHRKAESAREAMKLDAREAKENNNITCIAFDLMKTLSTPIISTGICYYKRQLWTYCLGIHNLGTDNAIMYVWNESLG